MFIVLNIRTDQSKLKDVYIPISKILIIYMKCGGNKLHIPNSNSQMMLINWNTWRLLTISINKLLMYIKLTFVTKLCFQFSYHLSKGSFKFIFCFVEMLLKRGGGTRETTSVTLPVCLNVHQTLLKTLVVPCS